MGHPLAPGLLCTGAEYPVALSVGGYDTGNGAGVSLDALVGRLLCTHFHSVPSAVVLETSDAVYGVEPLPPETVARMVSILAPRASAVKASLLATRRHVEAVAEALRATEAPLVLDPVHRATAGSAALVVGDEEDYLDALARLLVPRAALVAANAVEAEELTGIVVSDEDSMLRAAKAIVEKMGAYAAAVKGGHLGGDRVVDVLYVRGGRVEKAWGPKSPWDPHGGGCVFSAAATALLAHGLGVVEAFHAASSLARLAVADAYTPRGYGRPVADPSAHVVRLAGLVEACRRVREALAVLTENWSLVEPLVPETGMNIAQAAPRPRGPGDVAAVEGRLRRGAAGPVHGCVWPGASSHMARLLLSLQRAGAPVGAVLNARPEPWLLEAAERLGLRVLMLDRSMEPEPGREGGTMEWLGRLAAGEWPVDVIYDRGGWGKEPMARFLGGDALEAAWKLVAAAAAAGRRRAQDKL